MAALDLVSEGRLTNLGTIIAAGSQGKAVLRGGGVVFDGASGSGSTLTEGGGTDAQIRVAISSVA